MPSQRDDASLRDSAEGHAQSGSFTAALLDAMRIADALTRSQVQADIADAQAQARDFDAALATSLGIASAWHRANALRLIGLAQARASDLPAARQSFELAAQCWHQVGSGLGDRLLLRIAVAQAGASLSGEALMEDAEATAGHIQTAAVADEARRAVQAIAIAAVGRVYALDGDPRRARDEWERATGIAAGLEDRVVRDEVTAGIAIAMGQGGQLASAGAVILGLEQWDRAKTLLVVALALAGAGEAARAAEAAAGIENPWLRGRATAALAPPPRGLDARDAAPSEVETTGPEAAAKAEPVRPHHLDENVQFTVYRPGVVRPAEWNPLLAFAHLAEPRPGETGPSPLERVEQQATAVLGSRAREYPRVTQDSAYAVPREGEITFRPRVPGLEFNPPGRTFLWQEDVQREEFRFRAGPELDGSTARGRLTVFLGSLIVADIPLAIRVDHAFRPAAPPRHEVARARPYRKIFASYSHQDSGIVEEVERYSRSMGDRYLRDLNDLRGGEVWDDRLKELIEESDVFQLFWSRHSMRSDFVRQEWEHALSLRRPNFLRPTFWEDPFPESEDKSLPPPVLRRLHFERLPLAAVPEPRITWVAPPSAAAPGWPEAPTREMPIPEPAGRDAPPSGASIPTPRIRAAAPPPTDWRPDDRLRETTLEAPVAAAPPPPSPARASYAERSAPLSPSSPWGRGLVLLTWLVLLVAGLIFGGSTVRLWAGGILAALVGLLLVGRAVDRWTQRRR